MATNTEVFKEQRERIAILEKKNTAINSLLVFFIIITLLLAAYIIYIEVDYPPFGKWQNLRQEKLQTEQYNDYLLSRIDSIGRFNDLLMENSPNYTGIFFEVQIGAFEHFDLKEYQEALQNVGFYQENGLNKYVLGKFRSFDMAEDFQKDIQRMGINDAFIIAKIDGKRVPLNQALKAGREQKW